MRSAVNIISLTAAMLKKIGETINMDDGPKTYEVVDKYSGITVDEFEADSLEDAVFQARENGYGSGYSLKYREISAADRVEADKPTIDKEQKTYKVVDKHSGVTVEEFLADSYEDAEFQARNNGYASSDYRLLCKKMHNPDEVRSYKTTQDSNMSLNQGCMILGVGENATEAEIKAAFCLRIKETNLGLNCGNPEYERRFNEIAEAYVVLSDSVQNSDTFVHVEDIPHTVHTMYATLKSYRDNAKKEMAGGIRGLTVGLVVTIVTLFLAVRQGGYYVVMWGAIIFGGSQAIRSFKAYIKISKDSKEIEELFWAHFLNESQLSAIEYR